MTSETTQEEAVSGNLLQNIANEIIYSPLNLALVAIIAFLVYKIAKSQRDSPSANSRPSEPELPKLRRDFTLEELKNFDGNQEDGRVLLAVNGTVYDVTKGKRFYGPGGPYASFAGRDASRALGTFNVNTSDQTEYDDLSDLSAMEMDAIKEWELQFKEKYSVVGKLLRPGDQPTNYSDEDDDVSTDKQHGENESEKTAADILRKRVTNVTSEGTEEPKPAAEEGTDK